MLALKGKRELDALTATAVGVGTDKKLSALVKMRKIRLLPRNALFITRCFSIINFHSLNLKIV